MHLKKVEELKSGRKLFVFFSNDKGRGKNNCTIQVVTKGEKRNLTAKQTKNVLVEAYTTSWKGDINFSKRIQKILGVKPSDLVRYEQIKRIDDNYKNMEKQAMEMCFDLLSLEIKEQNKEKSGGFMTINELLKFTEKVYYKAWEDSKNFEKIKKV